MSNLDSAGNIRHVSTIVCLHCSGSSGRQWRALTEPLTKHWTIRTPDLLGYAAPGSWPSGAPVSLDDEVDHLSALLDSADSPVHLLGHSYGAAVALQVALRRPNQIASLTLYEPVRFGLLSAAGAGSAAGGQAAADAALLAEARYQITTTANRFALSVISGARQQAAEMFADYWGGPGTWGATEIRRRHLQAALMPKVNAEFQALFSDRVPASAYESLELPVRLMSGTASPLPARMVSRRLAALLPRVSTVSIAGLGHLGPISEPERVRAHLPRWLQVGDTWGASSSSKPRFMQVGLAHHAQVEA